MTFRKFVYIEDIEVVILKLSNKRNLIIDNKYLSTYNTNCYTKIYVVLKNVQFEIKNVRLF